MASKEADAAAKLFVAREDASDVYVYRPSAIIANGVKFTVIIDGKLIGQLAPSTFALIPLPVGAHTIFVTAENDKTQSFSTVAGKNAYLRVTPKFGQLTAAVTVELVTQEREAQSEIRACTLIAQPPAAADTSATERNE